MQFYRFWVLLVTIILLSSIYTSSLARPIGQILCHYKGYKCVRVKRGQSWLTLFPDHHSCPSISIIRVRHFHKIIAQPFCIVDIHPDTTVACVVAW